MFVILIILKKKMVKLGRKKTWKMESCICLFNFLSFDVNHFGIHTPKKYATKKNASNILCG